MNIEQLKAERDRLDVLIKEAEAAEWPKVGDTYYFPDPHGAVYSRIHDDFADSDVLKREVPRRTKAEAIIDDEYRMAVIAINKEIQRLNKLEGYVADWTDAEQAKWQPIYCYNDLTWIADYWSVGKSQFLFTDGSEATINSVLKSHAKHFEAILRGAP